jgi:hypothetical protein
MDSPLLALTATAQEADTAKQARDPVSIGHRASRRFANGLKTGVVRRIQTTAGIRLLSERNPFRFFVGIIQNAGRNYGTMQVKAR